MITLALIPSLCPRCEAEQKFVPKLRETREGWQEEYIYCPTCRFESVLRCTTSEIEVALHKLRGYEARAEMEVARHGTMSRSTARAIGRLRSESSQLTGELAQEVHAAHGSATHPNPT